MAPNLLIRAVNLSRKQVVDIDGLIGLRDEYLLWLQEAKNAVNNSATNAEKVSFLEADFVEQDLMENGGAGVDFKDDRAQKVLNLIREAISKRISEIKNIPLDDGKTEYDSEQNILRFRGVNIPIAAGRAGNRSTDLLKVLFSEPRRLWATDEILDVWSEKDAPKKAPYYAALSVNNKVALESGTTDFLLAKTKEISINPKYLSL